MNLGAVSLERADEVSFCRSQAKAKTLGFVDPVFVNLQNPKPPDWGGSKITAPEFGKSLAFENTKELKKPTGSSPLVWIDVWLAVVYLPR